MTYILGIIITFITVSIFPTLVSAIGSLLAMLPALILRAIPLILNYIINKIRNKAILYVLTFAIAYNMLEYFWRTIS